LRLSSRNMLLVLLTITLATSFGKTPPALNPATASPATIVKVDPVVIEYSENATGQEFTIAVKIVDVTGLFGFDIKFRWDATYLDYVDHTVYVPFDKDPEIFGVLWEPVLEVKNKVNATAGTYWVAYSSMGLDTPSFDGSGTVFAMVFRVKYHPVEPEPTAAVMLELYSTILLDRDANTITHSIENGIVTLRQIANPRIRPTLKVMPEKTEKLPTNRTFNINIWILGLNASYDIASFNVTLSFNSTLIEAIRITEGSWPRSYANGTLQLINQTDNISGTTTYALELIPPTNSSFTSGILFTVTFRVMNESTASQPPSCELTLAPTNLTDRIWGPILHMIENGIYTANRPPPVARFTWYPSSYWFFVGQAITFNASESYHPLGGHIELYQWDFGDGNITTTTSPTITHVYTLNETMTVTLKVIDYGGFWDTESITLYIFIPPPKPHLAVDPTYVRFKSYPPSAVGQQFDIKVYIKGLDTAWSLQEAKFSLSYNTTLIDIVGDGANVTIYPLWMGLNDIEILRPTNALGKIAITVQNPSVIPSGNELVAVIKFTVMYQGVYPAVDTSPLSLSDIELTSTFGEIPTEPPINGQIVIKGLSQPLSASFTYSPSNPKVNETLTFDASNSAPNGINIANYTWNFGDGNITEVSIPTITHRFSKSRTYNVTLTVTDIEGFTNATSKMITIEQTATEITPYIIAGIVAASVIIIAIIYIVKIRKPKRQHTMVSPKSKSQHERRMSTRTTPTSDGHGAYIFPRQ